MDKKKQMAFNLNNFLLSMSTILDYRQNDLYNTPLNHFKRVAYIALNLGIKFNFEPKTMSDLCSLSLVYTLDKNQLEQIPFVNGKEILKNELINEIIDFSSKLDKLFFLGKNEIENRFEAIKYAKENKENYSQNLINNFIELSSNITFWLDLEYENEILMFIYSSLHDFTTFSNFEDILKISLIFHKLINKDSVLVERAALVTDEFSFEHKDKQIFLIASSLQNIGKSVIPSKILYKKDMLTQEEFEIIKSYPYHTRRILNAIMGFSDISSLATKIQEKIDGSGYILGLEGRNLSLKDRLLSCLIIYNALREEKIYRKSHTHIEAITLMKEEAKLGKIDITLIDVFDKLFG